MGAGLGRSFLLEFYRYSSTSCLVTETFELQKSVLFYSNILHAFDTGNTLPFSVFSGLLEGSGRGRVLIFDSANRYFIPHGSRLLAPCSTDILVLGRNRCGTG